MVHAVALVALVDKTIPFATRLLSCDRLPPVMKVMKMARAPFFVPFLRVVSPCVRGM